MLKNSDRLAAVKNNRPFRRADILLYAALAGLIILLIIFAARGGGGNIAKIYSDGKLIKTMPLEIDSEFVYTYNAHYNVIKVSGGKISVTESDCPDGICMHYPPQNTAGRIIICLPHKLVIVIEGGADYDGIVLLRGRRL